MNATGIVGEFLALKEETDADLLAMQCGDFYEFFADDAETVADELDLSVSQKSSHGSSYPMAGVPVDELTPYVSALVERGYRVAVADQHETADGHAREVTRVVTPGTHLETADDAAQYLAALVADEDGHGLAVADVTTGAFRATTVEDGLGAALTELYKFDPAEVLPGPELRADDDLLSGLDERTDANVTLHATEAFAPARARSRAREQFGAEAVDSVGLGEPAVRAAGATLSYVEETGAGVLASITRLQRYDPGRRVALDATTQRNLELTETMSGDGSGSLVDAVDHTVTAAGGRLLREWIRRPRRDRAELRRRQGAVGALAEAAMAREELREVLGDAYDLARLASRSVSGSADPRDLRAVARTLELVESAAAAIGRSDRLADSPLAAVLDRVDREATARLTTTLDEALVAEPPGTVTEGGILARGYDEELDGLIEDHEAALEWIEALPDREKRRTGITHLTVDRNKTDGYYIQVGKSETDRVPEEYDRIKTLKNSQRYETDELAERERELFRLEERRAERERELFEGLCERVGERAELLQDAGRALAELDVLVALATHAVRNDWTRPELTEDGGLDVTAGRHPVVERTTEFVPNDLHMDEDRRFLIVTGPNMSGKSTYMRQAALIVLLAQIGSFVPAREATVGLVDGIYTRVGALDELAQGRSTFMVEMRELSNILHSATEESLVILDEVGRGTATYDGISIAWAATEYLHNEIGARTLFATHYHELTTLADHLDRVANVHVAVDGDPDGEDVTFLRTVREGPTDRSYGVHVADLAGVPGPVVDRSRAVLDRLREDEAIEVQGGGGGDGTTQAVFDLSAGEFTTGEDGGADTGDGDDGTVGGPGVDAGSEATDGDAIGGSATADGGAPGRRDRFGEEAEAVLERLADIEVDETPPVELMATVQELQDRLETDDG